MNKEQAKAALKAGMTIVHEYFSEDEFIYMEGDVLKDEKGYHMHDFWDYRQDETFDEGWEVIDRPTNELSTNPVTFIKDTYTMQAVEQYNDLLKLSDRGGYADTRRSYKLEERKFKGVNRNSLCPCGSGNKFKKCCIVGQ